MIELTSKQRKLYEKQAHNLEPIVLIGQGGITDNVIYQVSNALKTHELIKIKFNEYKDDKHEISKLIEEKTDSTLIRIIGNIAIFYKEIPQDDKRTNSRVNSKRR